MACASLANLYCCCISLLPSDERVIMMNTSMKNDIVTQRGKKRMLGKHNVKKKSWIVCV